jgi:hypothetical protein
MGCHQVAVITLHVFPNTANKANSPVLQFGEHTYSLDEPNTRRGLRNHCRQFYTSEYYC